MVSQPMLGGEFGKWDNFLRYFAFCVKYFQRCILCSEMQVGKFVRAKNTGLQRPGGGVRSPGAVVTGGCEPH